MLTSKNPNSYGVSWGPTIKAFTLRTSMSRHATASAITWYHSVSAGVLPDELYTNVRMAYTNRSFSGSRRVPCYNISILSWGWNSERRDGRSAGGCGAANLGDTDNGLVHGASCVAVRILVCRSEILLPITTHMDKSRSKVELGLMVLSLWESEVSVDVIVAWWMSRYVGIV